MRETDIKYCRESERYPPRRLKGFTLIEVLVTVGIIALLSAIGVGTVFSAQERARDSSALQSLQGYKDAFTTVCVTNPGIVSDRERNWTDLLSYTSELGLKKLVTQMNTLLDDGLVLVWDPDIKCYKSIGSDPWGGNFILTEYPIDPTGVVDYYDPTAGGKGMAAVSVWCTGNTDSISNALITDDVRGIALFYRAGIVESGEQGLNDSTSFTNWVLRFQ